MRYLYLAALKRFEACQVTKRARRCNQTSTYMGEVEKVPWVPPNHSNLEGPIAFGLTNPGCTDNRGDWLINKCQLADDATREPYYLEHLGVEFARDVSMQSTLHNTTQEMVASYLGKSPEKISTILVNTGIHDALIVPRIFIKNLETLPRKQVWGMVGRWADLFEFHLRTYLTLLGDALPKDTQILVFLSTLMQKSTSPAKNIFIMEFNVRMRRVCASLGYETLDVVPILDNPKGQSLYNDDFHQLHQNWTYYDVVWDLALRHMTPRSSGVRRR